jgi:hypothetical protein
MTEKARSIEDIRLADFDTPDCWHEGPPGSPSMQAVQDRRQLLKLLAWQPIDTAPSGVHVLITYPIHRGGATTGLMVLRAKKDSLGWDTDVWRCHEEPLHWMPLPEPPALSAEELLQI